MPNRNQLFYLQLCETLRGLSDFVGADIFPAKPQRPQSKLILSFIKISKGFRSTAFAGEKCLIETSYFTSNFVKPFVDLVTLWEQIFFPQSHKGHKVN
jgi:hypothetical protein